MTAIRELASLSERARRWTGEKEKERERRLAAQAPTPAQQEAAREANEKERKAAEERRAGIELDWKNKLRDIHAAEVVKDLGGQEVHIGGLTLEQIKALVSESEREARDNYYGYNRPPSVVGVGHTRNLVPVYWVSKFKRDEAENPQGIDAVRSRTIAEQIRRKK